MEILDLPVTMGPEGSPAQPTLRAMIAAYYASQIPDPVLAHAVAAEYCRQFEAMAEDDNPFSTLFKGLGADKKGIDLMGFLNGTKTFNEAFGAAGFGPNKR